jgi:hypothetical protein
VDREDERGRESAPWPQPKTPGQEEHQEHDPQVQQQIGQVEHQRIFAEELILDSPGERRERLAGLVCAVRLDEDLGDLRRCKIQDQLVLQDVRVMILIHEICGQGQQEARPGHQYQDENHPPSAGGHIHSPSEDREVLYISPSHELIHLIILTRPGC